jgi:hypothetical protein
MINSILLKKAVLNVCFISVLFCFSSCFEVIEEINLKNNGSGNATITLNLSKSKTKVASIMLLDSIKGYKVPTKQKIQKELDEVVIYLENTQGISNVKKSLDLENYIASVSFGFKDISNINHVNQNILKKLKIKSASNSSYTYSPAKNVFTRNYEYMNEAAVQYKKLKDDVKNIFKDAFYTSIYRFENGITSYNNKTASLSKSKKAIMLKTSVLDLINGKTNISNTIQLSN